MSSLRRLAWGVLFLLLVLGAGLPLGGYGLLASTAGTRWLLQTMAELTKSADFSLQIGEINGTLLDELQLREVRLRAAGSALDIETLALRWHPAALLARRLHVQALEFGGVRVQPPPPGPEPAEPPALPDLGLPLVVELERLRLDRLVVVQDGDDLAIETIAFGAHLDNAAWRVRELVVRGMGLDLTGEVGLGPQATHPLDGRLAGSVLAPEIGPVQAELQLSGAALTPAFDLAVRSPAVVRVQGAANLVEPEPSFRLDASWPQLNWPLQGAPQVETSAGRLELRGSPSDYRLELTTQVRGEGLPATEVRLQGQGDSRGLRLAPLTLRSGSGELTAKGPVDWQPAVTWDLALQARDLDPGMQFPDWPGRLSGELQVTGRLGEQGPEVEVAIAGIKGQLRDQALQASGAIRYAAGRLQARALDLVSGPNRLRLDGRADQQFDLAFDLDAPDLAALYPGLAGRLQGQGKLTGTTTAPLVVARLDGRDLAYDRLQVGELQLQADWGTNGGTAVLHAAALRSGEQRISSLNADLSGTALSHALQFQAEAPSFSVALRASGSLANGSWRGTLQRLDLTEPVLGDWALVAPAALELIRQKDRESLTRYAKACIDAVHPSSVGFGLPITTVSVVQGSALGGGMEAALSTHLMVAERQATMGLPEVLFNLFPGMGAFSFLSRRLGPAAAEDMIMSGRTWNAEELYERGIVDVLAEPGEGLAAARNLVLRRNRYGNTAAALRQVRQRLNPVTYQELLDVTMLWVDAALQLKDRDLKVIERLVRAQDRMAQPAACDAAVQVGRAVMNG